MRFDDVDSKASDIALPADMERRCPVTWKAFMGRKFVLPAYRQGDYYSQEVLNKMALAVMLMPALTARGQAVAAMLDDVVRSQLHNLFAALACDRPMMFLEKELGEILVNTEIPGVVDAADVHFPFPSFRVLLPKGLIGIASSERWAMFLDIGHLDGGAEIGCRRDVAAELDAYAFNRAHPLSRIVFTYPEDVLTISSQLDSGFASSYAVTKPLLGTLEELKAFRGHLSTDYPNNSDDDAFLASMQRLAINILLILSSMPVEYLPLAVERRARTEGKRIIPALVKAKWVGDVLLRAKRAGHVHGDIPGHGHKLAAHWRSGHWKHQPHGKGNAFRRLIYVMPYKTLGQEAA